MIIVSIKFHKPCYPLLELSFSKLTEISFKVEDGTRFGSNMEWRIEKYIINQANCDFHGSPIHGEGSICRTDAKNCQKLLDAVLKARDSFELEISGFEETVKLLESNNYLTSEQTLNYGEKLKVEPLGENRYSRFHFS